VSAVFQPAIFGTVVLNCFVLIFDLLMLLFVSLSLIVDICPAPIDIVEASMFAALFQDYNFAVFFCDVSLHFFEANWANAEGFPKNFRFCQVKAPAINAIGIRIMVLVTNLSCFFTSSISGFLRRITPETTRITSHITIGIRYA